MTRCPTRALIEKHRFQPGTVICHVAIAWTSISANLNMAIATLGISATNPIGGPPQNLRKMAICRVVIIGLILDPSRQNILCSALSTTTSIHGKVFSIRSFLRVMIKLIGISEELRKY